MKTFLVLLLSSSALWASLSVGCAAPAETADSTEAALGTWETTLTCNGGAAVLDVDPGERRQLQFVIRDPNAINYLTGAVGLQYGPLNRGNGRELIVAGWSDQGVFSPSNFQAFA
jgi:hypothetical protein